MGGVVKAPHKTLILRSIHPLHRVVAAQFQSLLHRSESWVAVGEPSQLNDVLSICGLSKRDPEVTLVHLDPQVEGEKLHVTHLEGDLHLIIEHCHLCILGAGDH
jgi:hypothetical protein